VSNLRPPLNELVKGLKTKADKIRVAHGNGYSRSEIAKFLGIRYQHVRNVLVDDERLRRPSGTHMQAAMAEAGRAFEHAPRALKVIVGKNGRLAVPEEAFAAIGVKEGDVLLVNVEGDEIRLYTPQAVIRRVQAHMREYIPEGVNLVDELIAERRQEAERESHGD